VLSAGDGENAALEKPFEDATAVGASGELIGQFTVHHLGEARFEQEVSIRRCHRPQDIVDEARRSPRRDHPGSGGDVLTVCQSEQVTDAYPWMARDPRTPGGIGHIRRGDSGLSMTPAA